MPDLSAELAQSLRDVLRDIETHTRLQLGESASAPLYERLASLREAASVARASSAREAARATAGTILRLGFRFMVFLLLPKSESAGGSRQAGGHFEVGGFFPGFPTSKGRAVTTSPTWRGERR